MPTSYPVSPIEFRHLLYHFLLQFISVGWYWSGHYEKLTEDLIHSSVRFQLDWFQRSTLIPTNSRGEATLIAASLRCLLISYEIEQISINWAGRPFENQEDTYVRLTELETEPKGGLSPSVELWKLADGYVLPKPNPNSRETLASMLQKIIQTAQQLLYRHRPEDWPYLFYVLCILLLVHSNLSDARWTNALEETAAQLKEALHDLCYIFHLCTENVQPLRSDFDIELYALSVNENELAVEHYRRMNEVWMENSTFLLHAGISSIWGSSNLSV